MEEFHPEQQEVTLRIPMKSDNLREELGFFVQLADTFREYGKSTDDLDFIIGHLSHQIEELSGSVEALPDVEHVRRMVAEHPYFRNPCDYPIRLITILKYLKRRGMNMNYTDVDLYVDRVITGMEGVRKVGRGLYQGLR